MHSVIVGLTAAAMSAVMSMPMSDSLGSDVVACARKRGVPNEVGTVTDSFYCEDGARSFLVRDHYDQWFVQIDNGAPGALFGTSARRVSFRITINGPESWYAVDSGPLARRMVRWKFDLSTSSIDVYSREWVRASPYGTVYPFEVVREASPPH